MEELLKDPFVTQLKQILEENAKKSEENILVEVCSCVDVLEKYLRQLIELQQQMVESQKAALAQAQKEAGPKAPLKEFYNEIEAGIQKMQRRYYVLRQDISTVKGMIRKKAAEIVKGFKYLGKAVLSKMAGFLKIKERLALMKNIIHNSKMDAKHTVDRIELFEIGMRRGRQQMANGFRALAGKEQKQYSRKEGKSRILDHFVKKWKKKVNILEKMEQCVTRAIDGVEKFAAEVDKERETRQAARPQEKFNGKGAAETQAAADFIGLHPNEANMQAIAAIQRGEASETRQADKVISFKRRGR